jgi:hypothetical protein
MNKLTTLKIALAAAALASQAAYAAPTDDLVIGFTGSAANEYDVIIGTATGGVVSYGGDLNSLLTSGSLNSVFGSSLNGVSVGIGGGSVGSTADLYVTQLHGSAHPNNLSLAQVQGGGGDFSQVDNGILFAYPTGDGTSAIYGKGNIDSYSSVIAPTSSSSSLLGQTSINNNSAIAANTLQEDLWYNSKGTGWVLEGTFTLDVSGATPTLTFATVSVPEPTTYGIAAGLGLLVLSLRRQFSKKAA